MNSVGELREFLKARGISPEVMAREIHVSNMTLRRLLEKRDSAAIPQRYRAQFSCATAAVTNLDFFAGESGPLKRKLIAAGGKVGDPGELVKQSRRGLSQVPVEARRLFSDLVAVVTGLLSEKRSPSQRLLLLGALAYFVAPFDAIPDALPGIGFVDDLGILTYARSFFMKGSKT